MSQVPCKVCKKGFYMKPFWLKRSYGKYCSIKCQHATRKNGKIVSCFICGEKVYKSKKYLIGSKSGKYFCGRTCQTVRRNRIFSGKKHANWKEGKYAYRNLMKRSGVPRECVLCGTKDERVLAVHHKDGHREHNTGYCPP